MKKNVSIAKRIIAACVVATGVAIVWFVVTGWVSMIAGTLLPARESQNDSFQVAFDGTPVIQTHKVVGGISLLVNRRTLDGKPWPQDYSDWLGGASFPAPYKPPGVVETPLPWDSGYYGRIAGLTDGKDPPGAWYFIRDNGRTGEVYVTGFDAISKLPIGYIGRNGFVGSKPPLTEQFNVPLSNVDDGFNYVAESSQELVSRRLVRSYQMIGDRAGEWTVSLLGTDCLWAVDLRQRSVRKRLELDGAISMNGTRISRDAYNRLPTQLKDERTEKEKELEKEAVSKGRTDGYGYLSVVRQPDRLLFVNLHEGKKETFLFPETLRDKGISAFLLGPDELLINAWGEYWSGGPKNELYWIDKKGKVLREKEVNLVGWTPPSPRARARNFGVSVPVPIVWLVGFVIGAPLYLLQINYATDFASAFSAVADAAWLPLVAVVLVATALAWLTVRLQKKYDRHGSSIWAAFVFLFGVPGFFAYLIEHRRAKREACAQCGEIVPRDRETCAACDVEFAPPPRLGTEIFA